jgi:hypothetical protein
MCFPSLVSQLRIPQSRVRLLHGHRPTVGLGCGEIIMNGCNLEGSLLVRGGDIVSTISQDRMYNYRYLVKYASKYLVSTMYVMYDLPVNASN